MGYIINVSAEDCGADNVIKVKVVDKDRGLVKEKTLEPGRAGAFAVGSKTELHVSEEPKGG